MEVEPEQLARRAKAAVLEGGAVLAGIADLSGWLACPTTRPLRALAFGLRYPDAAVERLPADDDLYRAAEALSAATGRIYATVERLLAEAGGDARYCRYEAVEDTFGAWRERLSQKAVAVLAGLGWIGKSSLLVTPLHGPRLRLGTLFTDAALPADEPFPTNSCGDCQVCRQACPAGAITGETVSFGRLAGYRIDAGRCRAHLGRNEPALGRREFCGLCLQACPFGR